MKHFYKDSRFEQTFKRNFVWKVQHFEKTLSFDKAEYFQDYFFLVTRLEK